MKEYFVPKKSRSYNLVDHSIGDLMNKSIVSMVLASLLIAPLAEARRNDRRENRQDNRIEQGVKSGEITRHEARKLERGQNRIDNAQDAAMEDGKMTGKEKLKIEKMQDHQSRKIYRQKHDGQDRNRAADSSAGAGEVTAPVEAAPQQ
jgi:hypothetical protein